MKIKAFCCCILATFTVFLCGCEHGPYQFYYDESEISNISIVYTLSGYCIYTNRNHYENILDIDDIEMFLTDFKQIKYSTFVFGDPDSVPHNDYAIKVNYKNGDYELISHCACDMLINNEPLSYARHCDKEEFDNFINSYLTGNIFQLNSWNTRYMSVTTKRI